MTSNPVVEMEHSAIFNVQRLYPLRGDRPFDNGRGRPPAVSAPGATAVQTKGRGHEHRVPVRTELGASGACSPSGHGDCANYRLTRWIENWLTPAGKAVWPITYYDMACEKFIERRERHGTDPETEEA